MLKTTKFISTTGEAGCLRTTRTPKRKRTKKERKKEKKECWCTYILIPDVEREDLLLLIQVNDLSELYGKLHGESVVVVDDRPPILAARLVGVHDVLHQHILVGHRVRFGDLCVNRHRKGHRLEFSSTASLIKLIFTKMRTRISR